METILFYLQAATIGILLLAIIFTAGIVWRVEMKLDVSYKFFLAGVIVLAASELLGIFSFSHTPVWAAISGALRMLFALFFLFGALSMRSIIRNMDGEKEE